jgi:hypothetical protein
MKRKFSQVYQFKIMLEGIKPPIWRRIQVPETYSFWDLHVAIQDSMGWLDYHLHEFKILNTVTGVTEEIGIPTDDDFGGEIEFLPGWERNIADYFSMKNPIAEYLYDFGDDWVHSIRLEQILPRAQGVKYPTCIAGERARPPEDCGGVSGYEEFLEVIMDPGHEEHEHMLEWAGGDFSPEYFNPKEVRFDDPDKRWKIAFTEEEE